MQVVPVLLSALPLKEDFDEVAPVSSALAAMLINPELALRLVSQKDSLLQVRGVCVIDRHWEMHWMGHGLPCCLPSCHML